MIHMALQAATTATTVASRSRGFGSSFLAPIARPIANVLAFFYSIVPNYAVAILILSVVWMVLISPLTLKTTRSMLAMQKLQPEMKRLQDKHRNDRQALMAAQQELYKEHNVSPFGSCLPSILPLPVFIALFDVIEGLSNTSKSHGVVTATPAFLSHSTAMYQNIVRAGGHLNAFGLDLSKTALSSHSSFAAALPFFVLLLVMMATQYFQTAQMMSRNPAQQQNSQTKIMKYLPLVFGVICIRFPAGVVLYYAMSNLCRITQQFAMYRFDPKVKALAIKDVIEVEARTTEIEHSSAPGRAASKGALAAPAAPSGGRTHFRDLLSRAVEQQAPKRPPAKAVAKGPARQNGPKPAGGSKGTGGGSPGGPKKTATAKSNGTSGATNTNGAPRGARALAGRPPAANGSGGRRSGGTTDDNRPDNASSKGGGRPMVAGGARTAPSGNGKGRRRQEAAPSPSAEQRGDETAPKEPMGAGRSRTGAGRTGAQSPRNNRRRGR